MKQCEHLEQKLSYRLSNNSFTMQCQECGKTFGSIAHADLEQAEKDMAVPVDESIAERYWESRRLVRELERRQERGEWFQKHGAYLRSPEWKAKRQ